MKIAKVHARQILDSRGNPTVEAEITLENGIIGRASVPSGASTGHREALELRDGRKKLFGGKGVLQAVANVNTEIAAKITGMNANNQKEIDEILVKLDGTKNKSRLGANAILAVSLANAKAGAMAKNISLYKHIRNISGNKKNFVLPMPMVNIINGGRHAAGSTDIQEFMIVPISAKNFSQAVRMCAEVFHSLGKVLSENGYGTAVGDEGGYAPAIKNGNEEAFELIKIAVGKAGYIFGEDIVLGIDVAASELYKAGKYVLKKENKKLTAEEMIAWYEKLITKYKLAFIEDGLDQNDWPGWQKLNAALGKKIQLIGDDLLVTNTEFLKRGILEKSCNSILIKLNQIGTLTETINAVEMAQNAGWKTVISHRSGETEDTAIAHLSVGLSAGQIKAGSMSRGERIAKYNELLRIEEELGNEAYFYEFKK